MDFFETNKLLARKLEQEKKKRLRLPPNEQMLVDAFLCIKTPEIMHALLKELLTNREYKHVVKRFEVAYWLGLGTPYKYVKENAAIGNSTISYIAKRLIDKDGGLSFVLKKLGLRKFYTD